MSKTQVLKLTAFFYRFSSYGIFCVTGNSTFCMIAEVDDIRVKSFKNRIKWDIVRPSWVFRCLNFDRLLPYRPEDLMVTTRATMEVMDKSYDRYGNSLTEATAVEDVPSILRRVRELVRRSTYFPTS